MCIMDMSYEGMAQRVIDDIRAGERPHGGNIDYLAVWAPHLAEPIIARIIEEADPQPQSIEEFADLVDFNSAEDKAAFIASHSLSESRTISSELIN